MPLSVAAASSSSPMATQYDVFISFRGEDTRNGFTSHLHFALRRNHIDTFIDYRIKKGGAIWKELAEVIRDYYNTSFIYELTFAADNEFCLEALHGKTNES
ncbi:hypothetical protein PIB30_084292, partial [Stylosanthes scabra]|nr:hypothetical protein [Stylosanthes scabra]